MIMMVFLEEIGWRLEKARADLKGLEKYVISRVGRVRLHGRAQLERGAAKMISDRY